MIDDVNCGSKEDHTQNRQQDTEIPADATGRGNANGNAQHSKENANPVEDVLHPFKEWVISVAWPLLKSALKSAQFWTAAATIAIAGATIVYTHYAAKQLAVMNAQLRASNEAFRLDERAWVEIEPIKPRLVAPASGQFGATFRYEIYSKNVGKTVANDVQFRTMPETFGSIRMGGDAKQVSFYQDTMLLTQMHASNANGSTADIPINQPLAKVLSPGTVAAVPFTLPGQEPRIFSKDEWVAYLIGRIDYTDAFGIPHWRKFCFFVARASGELWNCKEGNDEDRNPKNPPKAN